jgi:hypothetical protein
MKSCCIDRGERFFSKSYPFAGSIKEDYLTNHLLNISRKWGEITKMLAGNFYIRATPSFRFGVNAETGKLECDKCGSIFDYIFIGSRLYYFIWRINMICATYWDIEDKSKLNGLSFIEGSTDWPRNEHLEQLQIAYDMYFGDDMFLDTKGFKELKQQVSQVKDIAGTLHLYFVDFAELFVLMHEIQHIIPVSTWGPTPIGLNMQLPDNLNVAPQRANRWIEELNNDANSLYILFLSASSLILDKSNVTQEEAKTQAASLVCPGADAALHTLKSLEEQQYGKVDLNTAATKHEYLNHPPSELRRRSLAIAAYHLVTGKSAEAFHRKEFPENWKMVSQNVESYIKVRDFLFNGYKTRYQTKD